MGGMEDVVRSGRCGHQSSQLKWEYLMAMPRKAKAIEEQTVEVPELKIHYITMRIVGNSPLCLHAWSEKSKRMIQESQAQKPTQGKKNREPRDPEADFRGAMYLCDDGRPGIPARLFKAAGVAAANDVGQAKTVTKRAFFVMGNILPIDGPEPRMDESFVRLESGVADIRYRPIWDEWTVTITIRYNAGIMTAAHIVNLMRTAGFGCGVGEGRPNSPKGVGMDWGTFDVESAEGED
jgi:hypothetical protein